MDSSIFPESERSKDEMLAKIFSTSNSTERLSSADVAVSKSAVDLRGDEELLKYAAKGVLKKTIEAKNQENISTIRTIDKTKWGENESKKVWNTRCNRTEFAGVDLSNTYRTVFVNCHFDKDCTLPNDTRLVAQKYFLNCSFSKELLDQAQNKDLKDALITSGMEEAGKDGCYRTTSPENKRDGKPNTEFKPIQSFKFIEEIKLIERS